MKNECILWQGQVSPNGYGRMSDGKRYAHRVSYENTFGPIPEGFVVKHKCDNKLCVNTDHLEAGTQASNVKEAYDRKLRKPSRKLTNSQFKEIANRVKTESGSALAREFNVSRQLVCDIKKGRVKWGL